VNVTFAPVAGTLLAPVLAPLVSLDTVESLQDKVAVPPAVMKVVAVDPDLDGSALVAVSVTVQAALPPVHVKLADAAGASIHAPTTTSRASSPSREDNFILVPFGVC
jgi:hypothetical protein